MEEGTILLWDSISLPGLSLLWLLWVARGSNVEARLQGKSRVDREI